jgi:hypothetical protein
MRKRLVCYILFCVVITSPVLATSTGLNNIPTADVVPKNVLVFQYYSDIGNDKVPAHFAGFKYGLSGNIEVGLDSRFFAEKSSTENIVGQAKVRFEFDEALAIALGITNLGDRDFWFLTGTFWRNGPRQ